MRTLDSVAGWIELLGVPLALGLLAGASGLGRLKVPRPRGLAVRLLAIIVAAYLALIAVVGAPGSLVVAVIVLVIARFTAQRPALLRVGPPLALALAVTVAQPFGVRAVRVDDGEVASASAGPLAHHPIELFGVSVMRFALYEKPISHLGLGECCPPQDRLRVRSWIVPGVLTHAGDVAELHGDGASSRWSLGGAAGRWRVTGDHPPDDPAAWRLEAGVASMSGLVFWILAAAGIAAVLLRRRRLGDDGPADAHGVGGGVAGDEREPHP